MYDEVNPRHREIIDKLRELRIQSGTQFHSEPSYKVNLYFGKLDGEEVELEFDYGSPRALRTNEGTYFLDGGYGFINSDVFWKLLIEAFNVEIIETERVDSQTNWAEYYYSPTGPVVRLNPQQG